VIKLKVTAAASGRRRSETPLLYVLRDDLQLNGAKFGCGSAVRRGHRDGRR